MEFIDKDGSALCELREDLFAQEMDFPQGKPRWKLLVLRDGTVMFVWDHAIGEGQSALAFHRALLSALNRIRSHAPSEHSGLITDLPRDLALLPSLEEVGGRQMSVPFLMLVPVLEEEYLPFLFSHTAARTGSPVSPTITPAAHVRILQFSPSETSALLRVSCAHNATLTRTLHTLALVVLSRLISTNCEGEDAKDSMGEVDRFAPRALLVSLPNMYHHCSQQGFKPGSFKMISLLRLLFPGVSTCG